MPPADLLAKVIAFEQPSIRTLEFAVATACVKTSWLLSGQPIEWANTVPSALAIV
eukprot:CAMPEP_0172774212 /NCGR_PEP_ID=MMETSP1074-20121228/195743_1 /TAXON_ID=2916 /ORGANISM="Ceratium fusus, Strain PA161109" /LENGTH=54 /DNA_ID=CAMNT_0013610611 /DNA_START=122 /DNA_END=286 /DNA_ORIENTATION=+